MGEGLLRQFSLAKEDLDPAEGRIIWRDEDPEQATSRYNGSRVISIHEYKNEEGERPPDRAKWIEPKPRGTRKSIQPIMIRDMESTVTTK